MAFLHCEQQLPGWVYQPRRWGTSDGCVPLYMVWPYYDSLRMARARGAIDTARGIGLSFGSEEKGRQAWDTAIDDAFPSTE